MPLVVRPIRLQLNAGSLKRRARGSERRVLRLRFSIVLTTSRRAHETRFEHTPYKFVEIHAGRARRHRHQAVIVMPRHRVDLEQQRPARCDPS